MGDFFRFFRQSKLRLNVKHQRQQGEKSNEKIAYPGPIMENETNDNNKNRTKAKGRSSEDSENIKQPRWVINNPCTHVPSEKWQEIWNHYIERKANYLEGLVFINPNFARSYYVPSCSFRYGFDQFNEYAQVDLEVLSQMRNEQFDQWMKTLIQPTSCHVSMHCCQVIDILDRYCSRCPNLIRISFHFYHLDRNAIEYIVKFLPKLVSINFENSIGLNEKASAKLGSMINLLHLNLSGSDIYENSLKALLKHCQHLETLDISNNCAITGHCLSHERVKNLKRLNIQDCWRITPERLIDMCEGGLPNLIELLCNSGINDESMTKIAWQAPNLIHLDISFEEFTFHDYSGSNLLSDIGFTSIGELSELKILVLRHIGKLSDEALNAICRSCTGLLKIVVNVRHRHKLTDADALTCLGSTCQKLIYFEAVHNHFIAQNSISQLSRLVNSLQVLILRGNELIKDGDISTVIHNCIHLKLVNLDGCKEISDKTLATSIVHARKLPRDPDGTKPIFRASLVLTSIERTFIDSLVEEFPPNFRVRACNYRDNIVHYNEFDGKNINVHVLKEKFYPFYWCDYN